MDLRSCTHARTHARTRTSTQAICTLHKRRIQAASSPSGDGILPFPSATTVITTAVHRSEPVSAATRRRGHLVDLKLTRFATWLIARSSVLMVSDFSLAPGRALFSDIGCVLTEDRVVVQQGAIQLRHLRAVGRH